jgi:hypothetical protein
MYEARLTQGNLLKKIVDAIKDLVTEANFDVNSTGFGLQAMDNSHVSLVALQLRADGFEHYRCDRTMSMGERPGVGSRGPGEPCWRPSRHLLRPPGAAPPGAGCTPPARAPRAVRAGHPAPCPALPPARGRHEPQQPRQNHEVRRQRRHRDHEG